MTAPRRSGRPREPGERIRRRSAGGRRRGRGAGYYVEEEDLGVNNTVNIWPQPVGDLGLLRNVMRAHARSAGD